MSDLKTVIFCGYSGSGKGTQALMLKQYLEETDPEHKVVYFHTGDGFRKLQEQDNYTAKRIREVLDVGGLTPTFLATYIWTDTFIKEVTGHEHMIFDGVGRRENEAPFLHDAFQFYNRENPQVVFLDVSRESAFQRLSERGRYDDRPDEINRRLDWFEHDVLPVIDYYKKHGEFFTVHQIPGDRPMNEIHEDILERVGISKK